MSIMDNSHLKVWLVHSEDSQGTREEGAVGLCTPENSSGTWSLIVKYFLPHPHGWAIQRREVSSNWTVLSPGPLAVCLPKLPVCVNSSPLPFPHCSFWGWPSEVWEAGELSSCSTCHWSIYLTSSQSLRHLIVLEFPGDTGSALSIFVSSKMINKACWMNRWWVFRVFP